MTTDNPEFPPDFSPEFPKESVTRLAVLAAPWSREVTLSAVDHDSGMRMLRMRIREGRARFTILDLDEKIVGEMLAVMGEWISASAVPPADR